MRDGLDEVRRGSILDADRQREPVLGRDVRLEADGLLSLRHVLRPDAVADLGPRTAPRHDVEHTTGDALERDDPRRRRVPAARRADPLPLDDLGPVAGAALLGVDRGRGLVRVLRRLELAFRAQRAAELDEERGPDIGRSEVADEVPGLARTALPPEQARAADRRREGPLGEASPHERRRLLGRSLGIEAGSERGHELPVGRLTCEHAIDERDRGRSVSEAGQRRGPTLEDRGLIGVGLAERDRACLGLIGAPVRLEQLDEVPARARLVGLELERAPDRGIGGVAVAESQLGLREEQPGPGRTRVGVDRPLERSQRGRVVAPFVRGASRLPLCLRGGLVGLLGLALEAVEHQARVTRSAAASTRRCRVSGRFARAISARA